MNSTAIACLAAEMLGGTALGQASLTNLGVLSGDSESAALGVSADGLVAVGASGVVDNLQFRAAVRWTAAGGIARLVPGPAGGSSISLCANADGTVIAGGQAYTGFRWTSVTGMQDLGTLNGSGSVNAVGISADG